MLEYQILKDILAELKRSNELTAQLIAKVGEINVPRSVEVQPEPPVTRKRGPNRKQRIG